jgi:hypothetical protein
MKKWMLLLVLLSSQIKAEPSTTAKYLMTDYVSLFEWGLYRIEGDLASMKFEKIDTIFRNLSSVDYNWDSNRIAIDMTVYPSFQKLKSLGEKEVCRIVLTEIKEHFGFGYEKEVRSLFGIERYFKHKGFVKKLSLKLLWTILKI